MKKYIKILAFTLALIITLGSAGVFAAGAENENKYVKPEKFIYGDVNLDGSVTVKDATLIQKGLAKVTYVTAVQRYLADPEGTGYSVKNATEIQKYLAKYETTTPWNTEIPMASQDEFSSKIKIDPYIFIKYDYIIVTTENLSHTYSIEDFPEYNFTRIEKSSNLFGRDYYHLYLSESNIESVIEAIKALDYRANIDLYTVTPTYVAISA